MMTPQENPPESEAPPKDASPGDVPAEPAPRRSVLHGVMRGLRGAGRDLLSVALGRLVDSPEGEVSGAEPAASTAQTPDYERTHRRINILHGMAEQLRGAADQYVATKLDEIEARVDEKLDHIEARIDRKIAELHEQLAEMRDTELRHRVRLLKITLIFTVLVAALSLVYKWVSIHWIT